MFGVQEESVLKIGNEEFKEDKEKVHGLLNYVIGEVSSGKVKIFFSANSPFDIK